MINIFIRDVSGFSGAVHGMRNPMNSWERSDSHLCLRDFDDCRTLPATICPKDGEWDEDYFCIGVDDMTLIRKLIRGGTEHRKFLRMIHVQMDITAPLYWWKEFDTYKVGMTANSCSTMHMIQAKKFTLDDFSYDHLCDDSIELMEEIIEALNTAREYYNGWESNDDLDKELFSRKDMWWQMIQLLPSSYNQMRTIDMDYETVLNIIRQRKDHKLDEWREFCEALLTLPYMGVFYGETKA